MILADRITPSIAPHQSKLKVPTLPRFKTMSISLRESSIYGISLRTYRSDIYMQKDKMEKISDCSQVLMIIGYGLWNDSVSLLVKLD